jgi:hypothetical protein
MEGVDLNQPALVLWWADGDLPVTGFKWGGSSRQFGTLRDAINFVRSQLTATERGTAIINFDMPPYSLDFKASDAMSKAEELLKGDN